MNDGEICTSAMLQLVQQTLTQMPDQLEKLTLRVAFTATTAHDTPRLTLESMIVPCIFAIQQPTGPKFFVFKVPRLEIYIRSGG